MILLEKGTLFWVYGNKKGIYSYQVIAEKNTWFDLTELYIRDRGDREYVYNYKKPYPLFFTGYEEKEITHITWTVK